MPTEHKIYFRNTATHLHLTFVYFAVCLLSVSKLFAVANPIFIPFFSDKKEEEEEKKEKNEEKKERKKERSKSCCKREVVFLREAAAHFVTNERVTNHAPIVPF